MIRCCWAPFSPGYGAQLHHGHHGVNRIGAPTRLMVVILVTFWFRALDMIGIEGTEPKCNEDDNHEATNDATDHGRCRRRGDVGG